MKKILAIALLALCGCTSVNVTVDPVRSWEGHFYKVEDAQNAIKDMKLEEKESVWILSDSTLNRVLKNIQTERK